MAVMIEAWLAHISVTLSPAMPRQLSEAGRSRTSTYGRSTLDTKRELSCKQSMHMSVRMAYRSFISRRHGGWWEYIPNCLFLSSQPWDLASSLWSSVCSWVATLPVASYASSHTSCHLCISYMLQSVQASARWSLISGSMWQKYLRGHVFSVKDARCLICALGLSTQLRCTLACWPRPSSCCRF